MPGMVVTAEFEPEEALKVARKIAREYDFSLEKLSAWSFRAVQGSLGASIFLGAFIAYCDFEIEVNQGRYQGEVEVVINRNTPWWTGLIGVNRVKSRARDLATAIADEIHRKRGRRLKESEF